MAVQKPPFETPADAAGDASAPFAPADVRPSAFRRLDSAFARLRDLPGLTATASDVLDELGYALAVPESVLSLRVPVARPVVGHVVTLRYLPERMAVGRGRATAAPRLAHNAAFALAARSDVLVIDAGGLQGVSTIGAIGAFDARAAGLGGCIVDGAIRDLGDIRALGLPVWSRGVTPITGKWRLEATAINGPVSCGGVQVRPGDLAFADDTGVCFVPLEVADTVIERVLAIDATERAVLDTPPTPFPDQESS